jgi:hypothetical protein
VDVVTSWAPLLGGLLAAGTALGVLIAVAAWRGDLDPPQRAERRPSVDRFELRVVLAVVGVAGGLVATGWVAVAVTLGLAGWMAPGLAGLRARRRRQMARTEAVASWAEMLRDLLTSSAGLQEAIGKSSRVAPEAIASEVSALYVRAQRGDLGAALRRFAEDLGDPVADTVVAALLISESRVASDLGGMLAAVATSTRDTVAMQQRVAAARARTYRTSQLIAGIVGFFVGVLVLTNRAYLAPFGSAAGQVVLIVVLALVLGAVWAMLALSRPATTPRLIDLDVSHLRGGAA